ncbi:MULTISPECIES: SDR family NAD(P)-dependent oxidoreductase [unclassified Bradyrhizobium]|uniref:SDR family NAD(P)-dependent oxidoreductase n=1 Tax=unclassified Bradyrhizobium TaxID=2631580 RepID=UPI0028E354C4|nr:MULTISPECIES: SDR family NAD(P)-dependent oxidoreductase [unclassified Bradyrhizobium]
MITGASSGIGLEFARQLASAHDLILVARRQDLLEARAAELGKKFVTRVQTLPADLTSEAQLSMVAERIAGEKDLALVVNCAGFGLDGFFWETGIAEQESMHRLHVMATVKLTHAALKNLVAKDSGGVINVSSVAGFVWFGNVSYGATKAWMKAFGEGVCIDLRAAGSRVTMQTLCPGYTRTDFQQAMGLDPRKVAPPEWWSTASDVVSASLAGLARGTHLVVPGWRNRALIRFFSLLPWRLRCSLLARKARGGRGHVAQ